MTAGPFRPKPHVHRLACHLFFVFWGFPLPRVCPIYTPFSTHNMLVFCWVWVSFLPSPNLTNTITTTWTWPTFNLTSCCRMKPTFSTHQPATQVCPVESSIFLLNFPHILLDMNWLVVSTPPVKHESVRNIIPFLILGLKTSRPRLKVKKHDWKHQLILNPSFHSWHQKNNDKERKTMGK